MDTTSIWNTKNGLPPVVAVDVDDVLNLTRTAATIAAGYTDVQVTLDPWVQRRFLAELTDPVHILHLNPRFHGDLFRRWIADGVQVVWATTWEDNAARHLNPIYQVDIPVGISTVTHPPQFRDSAPTWKINALNQAFPDRTIGFIDDAANPAAGPRGRDSRAFRANPLVGLDPSLVAKIDRWLDGLRRR